EAETDATADWTGAIGNAFFTDSAMTSLRSESEIRSNWSSLSTEQQAQVEADCNTIQTASASPSGTTVPGSSGTSGPSGDTASTTLPSTSGGSTSSGTSGDTAASSTTPSTSGGSTGSGTSSDTTASTMPSTSGG